MVLPNFFIGGAGKSGTTTIWKVLKEHYDVFMPYPKEPSFFTCSPESVSTYHLGLDWYMKLFEGASQEKCIGEASTLYLRNPDSPKLIMEHVGKVKFIFVFRHPTDRAYSHYWFLIRNGHKLPSFDQVVLEKGDLYNNLILGGKYFTQLQRFLDIYPRESILCLRFEQLKDNPRSLFREIYNFLEIEDIDVPDPGKHNVAASPYFRIFTRKWLQSKPVLAVARRLFPRKYHRSVQEFADKLMKANLATGVHPPISSEIRTELNNVFLEEVNGLEQILSWDLGNWKK